MTCLKILLAIIGTFLLAISYQALAAYLKSPEGLKYPNPGHYPGEIGPGTFNCSGETTNCYWKFPKALFIDSDKGRVGIKTETPKEELDVSGDIHASGDICSDGVCLGDAQYFRYPQLAGMINLSPIWLGESCNYYPCRTSGCTWDSPIRDVYTVYVSGRYAYIGSDLACLSIVDISNPIKPEIVGKSAEKCKAKDILISGNYVHVYGLSGPPLSPSCYFYIFNISDPTNPTLINKTYAGPSSSCPENSTFVSGEYKYVADMYNGLKVYDISDPSNPVLIGVFPNPRLSDFVRLYFLGKVVSDRTGLAEDVHVSGRYAYVPEGPLGALAILDTGTGATSSTISQSKVRNLKVYGDGEIEGDLEVGGGVVVGNPAGGNMGKGKINAEGIYVNGSKVWGECISIPKSCSCNPLAGGCPCNPGAAGCPAGYSSVYVSSEVLTGSDGTDLVYLSLTTCCRGS